MLICTCNTLLAWQKGFNVREFQDKRNKIFFSLCDIVDKEMTRKSVFKKRMWCITLGQDLVIERCLQIYEIQDINYFNDAS